jgi:hypothetical protein
MITNATPSARASEAYSRSWIRMYLHHHQHPPPSAAPPHRQHRTRRTAVAAARAAAGHGDTTHSAGIDYRRVSPHAHRERSEHVAKGYVVQAGLVNDFVCRLQRRHRVLGLLVIAHWVVQPHCRKHGALEVGRQNHISGIEGHSAEEGLDMLGSQPRRPATRHASTRRTAGGPAERGQPCGVTCTQQHRSAPGRLTSRIGGCVRAGCAH